MGEQQGREPVKTKSGLERVSCGLLLLLVLLLLSVLLLLLLPLLLFLLCFKDFYRIACVYGLFWDFISFLRQYFY